MSNEFEFSSSYFIRDRGKVSGPFELEHVRALVQRGRIGRHLEVSLDGKSWERAATYPELFESQKQKKVRQRPKTVKRKSSTERPHADSPTTLLDDKGRNRKEKSAEREWFYLQFGEKYGPVKESELRDLLASGDVIESASVWTAGMKEWELVTSMRALTTPPNTTQPVPVDDSFAALATPSTHTSRYVNRARRLRALATRFWLGFAAVAMITAMFVPWWFLKIEAKESMSAERKLRLETRALKILHKESSWLEQRSDGFKEDIKGEIANLRSTDKSLSLILWGWSEGIGVMGLVFGCVILASVTVFGSIPLLRDWSWIVAAIALIMGVIALIFSIVWIVQSPGTDVRPILSQGIVAGPYLLLSGAVLFVIAGLLDTIDGVIVLCRRTGQAGTGT